MSAEPRAKVADRHLRICQGFGDEVRSVGEYWQAQSPCTDWDARGVLEHVIGFHDVLLLRPLDAKPHRPKDDPVGRWTATVDALRSTFSRPDLFSGVVNVPAIGNNAPSQMDAVSLVRLLSQDVLVHTWDLARAVGREKRLDPELCEVFLGQLPANLTALSSTGMYDSPWEVRADSDAHTRLLARLGRNPDWIPSTTHGS